jgi:hypothetical protein
MVSLTPVTGVSGYRPVVNILTNLEKKGNWFWGKIAFFWFFFDLGLMWQVGVITEIAPGVSS